MDASSGTSIVLLISSLRRGGSEKNVRLLAEGFHRGGFNTKVVTFSPDTLEFVNRPAEAIEHINIAPIQIIPSFARLLQVGFALANIVRSRRSKVIICFGRNASIAGYIASRLSNATCHISIRHNLRKERPGRLKSYVDNKILALADRVSVQHRNAYNALPEPIREKAVILPTFAAKVTDSFTYTNSPLCLLAISRLVRDKNLYALVTAISMLVHDGMDDIKLSIKGSGPCYPALVELIRALELENYVELTGFCEKPFEGEYSALVVSSLHEGFSNVVLEAYANRLPILISGDTSSGFLDFGEDGIEIDGFSPAAIYQTIRQIYIDRKILEVIRNRMRPSRLLSEERVAERWMKDIQDNGYARQEYL